MLTPDYLQKVQENVSLIVEAFEDEIIEDIAKRIGKNVRLTGTAQQQMRVLENMGYDVREINAKVAKAMDTTIKDLELIIQKSTMDTYEMDRKAFAKGGHNIGALGSNESMRSFIEATVRQTMGEMENFTRTTGFAVDGTFKAHDTFYRDQLNRAVFEVSSGAIDADRALRKAVNVLGQSGIKTIAYQSGVAYSVEAASRMTILTGLNQITGHVSEANADRFQVDLMEITAHSGARPDHAEWQGKIVSRSGQAGYLSLADIRYGDVAGFQGANCRHNWYPFFEGSKRAYTDSELSNIDPPPFTYEGKQYTAYEATQRQRQIERAMRKSKRDLIAYDAAGLKQDFTVASIRLRRQRELYEDFSKTAGLFERHQRHNVYKYGRTVSSKSVWAERKARL